MAAVSQAPLSQASAPRPVLLVDGDDAFGATLAAQLSAGGFAVTQVATASEAEAQLGADGTRFGAMLLDAGLPGGEGHDLCARLRGRGLRQPILMLSAQDDEGAMLRGLAHGANDWIRKPCRPAELQARLRAQLRVFDDSVHAVFAVGPYEFQVGSRKLVKQDGRRQAWLTNKEAQLLKLLCLAGGRPVPRKAVLDDIWGAETLVDAHALETHVYRLRRKIEPTPSRPRFLTCSKGYYQLEGSRNDG